MHDHVADHHWTSSEFASHHARCCITSQLRQAVVEGIHQRCCESLGVQMAGCWHQVGCCSRPMLCGRLLLCQHVLGMFGNPTAVICRLLCTSAPICITVFTVAALLTSMPQRSAFAPVMSAGSADHTVRFWSVSTSPTQQSYAGKQIISPDLLYGAYKSLQQPSHSQPPCFQSS